MQWRMRAIKAGTVALSVDTYNVLPGAAASMRGTFSDTTYEITGTPKNALDIPNYLDGVVIIPAFFDSAKNVSSLILKLKTDNGNYYEVQSSQDSVGDYLADGQMVRFWLRNATKTGSPSPTNITAWELDIQMASGTSQTVVSVRLASKPRNSSHWNTNRISSLLMGRRERGRPSQFPAITSI